MTRRRKLPKRLFPRSRVPGQPMISLSNANRLYYLAKQLLHGLKTEPGSLVTAMMRGQLQATIDEIDRQPKN